MANTEAMKVTKNITKLGSSAITESQWLGLLKLNTLTSNPIFVNNFV